MSLLSPNRTSLGLLCSSPKFPIKRGQSTKPKRWEPFNPTFLDEEEEEPKTYIHSGAEKILKQDTIVRQNVGKTSPTKMASSLVLTKEGDGVASKVLTGGMKRSHESESSDLDKEHAPVLIKGHATNILQIVWWAHLHQ